MSRCHNNGNIDFNDNRVNEIKARIKNDLKLELLQE